MLIGIVGRLCEVKNHAMAFAALAQLLEKASVHSGAVHLVVIGDGHLAEALSAYAEHLKIADHMTFAGFREDVLALYAELDIVSITSLNEGTPLTLIEAMCCGRAVAATEVDGVVDILGESQMAVNGFAIRPHGVAVPSHDVAAFARALQYLIERPLLRQDMGLRGRAFIRRAYSKDRLLHDIDVLYRDRLSPS